MSRDYRKLRVFALAHELAVETYQITVGFPADERYGLQRQVRRAAVSVPTNIVEGSARGSIREYVRFLDIALGSAYETRYLIELSAELGFLSAAVASRVSGRYSSLVAGIRKMELGLAARVHREMLDGGRSGQAP